MLNQAVRPTVLSTAGRSTKAEGSRRNLPRHAIIGIILVMALISFELFNYDTTRYALDSLLGDIRFLNMSWAVILAIAFCSIDFAGLAKLLTPERGSEEPKEVWYLMGAWLLGATMNAVMTWWAVSLTLLASDLGNEVLSHEQLLRVVPVFVAALVWLTRILLIGALTMTGEKFLQRHPIRSGRRSNKRRRPVSLPKGAPVRSAGYSFTASSTAPMAAERTASPAQADSKGRISRPDATYLNFHSARASSHNQARGHRP